MVVLTEKERKILIRINEELAIPNHEHFPEFPELKKEDIRQGMEKLQDEGLIKLDKESEQFETTEKGEDFIRKHEYQFKDIEKQFFENLKII